MRTTSCLSPRWPYCSSCFYSQKENSTQTCLSREIDPNASHLRRSSNPISSSRPIFLKQHIHKVQTIVRLYTTHEVSQPTHNQLHVDTLVTLSRQPLNQPMYCSFMSNSRNQEVTLSLHRPSISIQPEYSIQVSTSKKHRARHRVELHLIASRIRGAADTDGKDTAPDESAVDS